MASTQFTAGATNFLRRFGNFNSNGQIVPSDNDDLVTLVPPMGITGPAPILPFNPNYPSDVSYTEAAIAGQPITLLTDTDNEAEIEAGGVFNAGDPLMPMSDASGRAIKATAGKNYGAIARQASTGAGSIVIVNIQRGYTNLNGT